MWIEQGGGVKFLNPDGNKVTLALTDPTGTVILEQMGVDKDDWFEYKQEGSVMTLNADNTARGIYAPIRLRITATGTGVRLYNRKLRNKQPVIVRS